MSAALGGRPAIEDAPAGGDDTSRRPRIAVVDYGAGNLVSIGQALELVGADVAIATGPGALAAVDALVVPGVGAAAPAMRRLGRRGMVGPIEEWARSGRPFLGICLGLQLLFDGSDEDGARTLGVIPGRVRRLLDAPTLPHVGWNQLEFCRADALLDGLVDGEEVYFVHSYAGIPEGPDSRELALTMTTHGGPFVSAIGRGMLYGVQFHPERSGSAGLRLLANFVGQVRDADTAHRNRPSALPVGAA